MNPDTGSSPAGEKTTLNRHQIRLSLEKWIEAWNIHDLEKVMEWMDEEVVFRHWDGSEIKGKETLKKIWSIWFANHGDFSFEEIESFIDEEQQKILFRWLLRWPSRESGHQGKTEMREGVDVLHLRNGKIILKETFSKTSLDIEGEKVILRHC